MVERVRVKAPSNSGNTVTVACRMPSGMRLRLFEFEEKYEQLLGGGSRKIKEARPIGEEVVIKGWYTDPKRRARRVQLPAAEGEYALTFGVNKDFWDRWLEQNRDADYVKNRVIFAHSSPDHVDGIIDECEQDEITSGLEPLDPDRPPRDMQRVKTYDAGSPSVE